MKPAAEPSPIFSLKNTYDVIVVGGGIQGATLTWMAACRGFSVLLLEQNDFGSGVSANSLKIIHGGIRYLQSLDFPRMRQSIRERRMLLRIAPHLVHPMRCVIPAYGAAGKGRLALGLGTMIYDIIAMDRNRGLDPTKRIKRSRLLSSQEISELLPMIDHADTAGGAEWWDAMVYDSERLVLCFVMSARQNGADACNHVGVEKVLAERGRARGVLACDRLTGDRGEFRGSVIMDCTGSWSNFCPSVPEQPYARAMNLLIRQPLGACAFGARGGKSGGMLFFVPWKDGTIAGTWYSRASKNNDPNAALVSRREVENALEDVNSVFPRPMLSMEDITALHLGMLPALPDAGKAAGPELSSRFTIMDQSDQGAAGLIRVQGVKYTTARDVSARAIERALPYLGGKPRRGGSCPARLYGNDTCEVDKFRKACLQRYVPNFSDSQVRRLMDNYGTHIDVILSYAHSDPALGLPVPGATKVLRAELAFVIDHEMVRTLSDLIFRRTDLGTFAMPPAETIAFCADFTADRLGWDDKTKNQNIKALWRQFPLWMQTHDFHEHAGVSGNPLNTISLNHAVFSVNEEV